ncbi:MAG: filamentous hemagglutinin N-terminal domain-containing protein [Leptolyngbyaceae cyanobacterium MO_188.B28]|nr:filamentous hemagglutinin N-terminal domain-containing protein [Leptolyngbyaceae cyanobacterium MO_188.B28]
MNIWRAFRLVASGFAVLVIASNGAAFFAGRAHGQMIVPDNTLMDESSVFIPGDIVDLIEGGATRGSALFHSFAEFNVYGGRQVYFANPVGIENILSRVTGLNPSQIDGLLGVDGAANLFFLNPNGIIFGPDAQLDVEGAFLASTSDRFSFADGSEFRATDPNEAPLVTINIPLGLQLGTNAPEMLMSEADLAVGGDLTLSASSVTSTGLLSAPNGKVWVEGVDGDVQVQAVESQSAVLSASEDLVLEESRLVTQGDMSLLAGQTVRIRDSKETAFLAAAGGDLLIQGESEVDILALNHPQTPFQSGGDMTLASDGPISSDAHFFSWGNLSIEDLDGNPGPFISFYDPIIRSNGDVTFGKYEGVALKVQAAGSITVNGDITITGPDPGFEGVMGSFRSIGNTNQIASGSTITSATISNSSGSVSAAEVDSFLSLDGLMPGETIDSLNTQIATEGSAIEISFDAGTSDTTVSFSWDFQTFEGFDSIFNDFAFASLIETTTNTLVGLVELADTGSSSASPQTFTITPNESYALGIGVADSTDTAVSSTLNASNFLLGADPLNITGGDPDIPLLGSRPALILRAGVPGTPNEADNGLPGGGSNPFPITYPYTDPDSGTQFTNASTSGANITVTGRIKTSSVTVAGGPVILTAPGTITAASIETGSTVANSDSGNVLIEAGQAVAINSGIIDTRSFSTGDSGEITITGSTVNLVNSQLRAGVVESGESGTITVTATGTGATDSVTIDRSIISTVVSFSGDSLNRGGITLSGQSVFIQDGSAVLAATSGVTPAGEIIINATDSVVITGTTPSGQLGSRVSTSTNADNSGEGGDITINVPTGNLLISDRAFLDATTRSTFDGGDIILNVNNLTLEGGGQILTTAFNSGKAGAIDVNATGAVNIQGTAPEIQLPPSVFQLDLLPTGSDLVMLAAGGFSTVDDPNIEQAATIPYQSFINTPGNNEFVYYSFEVPAAGAQGIFDIDNGIGGSGNIDTQIFLFDEFGNLLAANDDNLTELGEGGSTSRLDSYLNYVFLEPGTYVLGVSEFFSFLEPTMLTDGTPVSLIGGNVPDVGDSYDLHISIENLTPQPSPVQSLSSGIFAQTSGSGGGGTVTIDASTFSLTDAAQINAGATTTTTGTGGGGNSGSIGIAATGAVTVSGNGVITNQVINGTDNGDITIQGNTVAISDSSQIQASTSGSGNSEVIRIIAVGNDGNAATPELSMDNSVVTATSSDAGTAGSVELLASNNGNISVSNSGRVSANTLADGEGGGITIAGSSLAITGGSVVQARTSGTGPAGSIEVTVSDQILVSGTNATGQISELSTSSVAVDSGLGGNIRINQATNPMGNLELSDRGRIGAETFGNSNSGDVEVYVNVLDVSGGGQIRTTSTGTGRAGDITVVATDSATISGIASSLPAGAAILPGSLVPIGAVNFNFSGDFFDSALLTTSFGSQFAIDLESRLGITGGELSSLNSVTATEGSAVQVFFSTTGSDQVLSFDWQYLTNEVSSSFYNDFAFINVSGGPAGATVTNLDPPPPPTNLVGLNTLADTNIPLMEGESGFGLGSGPQTLQLAISNPGDYVLGLGIADARDTAVSSGLSISNFEINANPIELVVTEQQGSIGTVDPTQPFVSGLFAEAQGDADAGNISVTTGQMTVANGAEVSAATLSGTAGSVTINTGTGDLEVLGGSEISVSSNEAGAAGGLNIAADSILLDGGKLTAETGAAGDETSAQIILNLGNESTLENILWLRNESEISATAIGGVASGGNIEIDADFIIAEYPTGPIGSDIFANAGKGAGGNVRIDALGVFGIQFRPKRTPLNDITASSEEGLQGTVVLNILNTDPDSGLAELAFEFDETSKEIISQCSVDSSGGGSSVASIGRGGLPPIPTDALGAALSQDIDWVTLEPPGRTAMTSEAAADEALNATVQRDRRLAFCSQI